MLTNLPEVRLKPIVFQKVEIHDPTLVFDKEDGLKQYDEYSFIPDGDVEPGDCLLIRPGHNAIHVTQEELDQLYVPNDDANWDEKLIEVSEKGFDYAMYHLRSGLPVERCGIIIVMQNNNFYYKIDGTLIPWMPDLDDLLATDWKVAIGELQ